MTGIWNRIIAVAGIESRLTAAGLAGIINHLTPHRLKQMNGCLADFRNKPVHQAWYEQ
jgi:hypothetical protein